MHIFRLYGHQLPSGDWVVSDEDMVQAYHVLKLAPGDKLELMDMSGHCISGVVKNISKKMCVVLPDRIIEKHPKNSHLRLAVGAMKVKNFYDILPRLVEIGVDELMVFGQHSGDKSRTDLKVLEKGNKIIKEAAKVAKTVCLTKLSIYDSIESLVDSLSLDGCNLYVAEHGASQVLRSRGGQSSMCIIGSERGILDSEAKFLRQHDFEPVSMGPYILRASTALFKAGCILG